MQAKENMEESMIKIRDSVPEDLPLLESLYDQIGHKDPGYFEQCLKDQEEDKRLILIAALNGKDVGFGMLSFAPRYALYKKLDIPEIQDLNVIPDARRQGVATAVLEHCENLCRDKGHEQIGLGVGLTKEYGPAQKLYGKLGYIADGYGVTCDREPAQAQQSYLLDDNLCLMMVKDLLL